MREAGKKKKDKLSFMISLIQTRSFQEQLFHFAGLCAPIFAGQEDTHED